MTRRGKESSLWTLPDGKEPPKRLALLPSAACGALLSGGLYDKSGSKMGTDRRRIRSLRKNRCGLRSGGENCKKEFSISRRIDTAEKVTIEEYYETRAGGKAGASIDPVEKSGSAGLGGNGERVTKRVYTFEGAREITKEEVETMKACFHLTAPCSAPTNGTSGNREEARE